MFPPPIHSCPWSARALCFSYVVATILLDVMAFIRPDMYITTKCCTLPMAVAFPQLHCRTGDGQ
eukprot:9344038-Alexandrium_andersonii.AAC.1